MMKISHLVFTIAALFSASVHAATSLNLANYSLSATYGLDVLNGLNPGISGLEASAVTYARDRNSLFYVGDEGRGVVEISLTGATLGYMNFNWSGTGSTNNDTEGLTYLGVGQLVVAEERLQNAYLFNYNNGGTVNLSSTPYASLGLTIGNVGIEGISYDSSTGNYVSVKQDNPAQLNIYNSLTFSTAAAVDVVPNTQFSGAASVFGLNSLSDVQTLSSIDALTGSAAANNLLVLSHDSKSLIEIDRLGNTLSSFNLATLFPNNAVEGVTVDYLGNIYLVAEQSSLAGATSQLIVLTAPVPEPETYAMFLTGLGLMGVVARRKNKQV